MTHPAPHPVAAPSPSTLWRLSIRDGHTGQHDMSWVRERYRGLLEEYGLERADELHRAATDG